MQGFLVAVPTLLVWEYVQCGGGKEGRAAVVRVREHTPGPNTGARRGDRHRCEYRDGGQAHAHGRGCTGAGSLVNGIVPVNFCKGARCGGAASSSSGALWTCRSRHGPRDCA